MSGNSGGEKPPDYMDTRQDYASNEVGVDNRVENNLNSNDNQNQKEINGSNAHQFIFNSSNNSSISNSKNESSTVNNQSGTSKNSHEQQKQRTTFLYSNTDAGPYHVYVESNKPEFNGKLNGIKVGEIIYKLLPEVDNKIKQIESVGRNRIRVVFKDYKNANILIQSQNLRNQFSLDAYIPQFLLHRIGVIKRIQSDISEEYLKTRIKPFDMHCNFTIANVHRIHRKQNDRETKEYLPTTSVIVTFKSQQLPKYVSINHVIHSVEPYIQKVVLCYNCYRYGHTGSQCKSNSRCQKCHENHNTSKCENVIAETKCFYCSGNHLTSNFEMCPEFKRQKLIKVCMSESNLSYRDASLKVPKKTYASVTTVNIESYIQNNTQPAHLPSTKNINKRIKDHVLHLQPMRYVNNW